MGYKKRLINISHTMANTAQCCSNLQRMDKKNMGDKYKRNKESKNGG
jgi:hypothetical protein